MTVFKESWFIRKALYQVAAVVFLVLTGFGVFSDTEAATMLEQVNTGLVPLVAALITQLAAAKTNPASDVSFRAFAVKKDPDTSKGQAKDTVEDNPTNFPVFRGALINEPIG